MTPVVDSTSAPPIRIHSVDPVWYARLSFTPQRVCSAHELAVIERLLGEGSSYARNLRRPQDAQTYVVLTRRLRDIAIRLTNLCSDLEPKLGLPHSKFAVAEPLRRWIINIGDFASPIPETD